jgi:hypothetical protein
LKSTCTFRKPPLPVTIAPPPIKYGSGNNAGMPVRVSKNNMNERRPHTIVCLKANYSLKKKTQRLELTYAQLDPFDLKKNIANKLRKIFKLEKNPHPFHRWCLFYLRQQLQGCESQNPNPYLILTEKKSTVIAWRLIIKF